MKRIIIVFLCLISISLSANTYYVSTTGSDAAAGTIAAPWATLQKAFDVADAGDTVYFRGGTYYFTGVSYHNPGVTGEGAGHGNNGTQADPICFFNYPGEVPIFDYSLHTSATDATGFDVRNSTYIKFKGLTIQNENQIATNQWKASMLFGGGATFRNGNIYLEQIVCRNGGGYGIWCIGFDTLSIINCDSYGHYDSNDTEPGNTADGFTIGSGTTTPDSTNLLIFYGNRAWGNSDDAFEISPACELDVHDNWSFLNGWNYYPSDGHNSFKVAMSAVIKLPEKRRFYKNLCAFNNGYAFSEVNLSLAAYGPVQSYLNNTIYKCKSGFGSSVGSFNCATGYAKTIIRNNIVYSSWWSATYDQSYLSACAGSYATVDHNTWRKNVTIPYWEYNTDVSWSYTGEDAQFASLPTDSADCRTILSAPRQADGSLPEIGDYFKLDAASVLIDAGVDVGLPYLGAAPDIGYAEYGVTDSTAKYILSFSLAAQTGVTVIDTTAKTVALTVEYGTDVTALAATFSLSTGATAAVGATPQVSEVTTNNFTNPVTYVVTDLNTNTVNWTITVTIETEPVPTVATVATTSASAKSVLANVTGNVITNNGGTQTNRGICFSTSASPVIGNNPVYYSTGTGAFTCTLRGLAGGTTYNARAFATTSQGGTAYGDNVSFTTPNQSPTTSGGKVVMNGTQNVIIQ